MVENIEMIASVGNLTDASYVSGMCVDWAKYPLWQPGPVQLSEESGNEAMFLYCWAKYPPLKA